MPTPIGSERGEELFEEGIRTVVRAGMESPYRDAIIEGIEDVDEELLRTDSDIDDSSQGERTGSTRKVAKNTSILLITIVLLYAFYRWQAD